MVSQVELGARQVDLGLVKPVPGEFVDRWRDNRLQAIRLYVTDGLIKRGEFWYFVLDEPRDRPSASAARSG